MTFALDLNDLPEEMNRYYSMFATHVSVKLMNFDKNSRKLVDTGGFSGKLIHSGRSKFRTKGLTPIEFSVKPRVTGLPYASGKAAELGAREGKYVGLSPFSDWTLIVDRRGAPRLSSVEKIQLTFTSTYRIAV